jgi:hypothetical protein
MDSGVVVVPWEHWVCTQCLQDNPYAVWLIKLKCFNPTHHHYPDEKTLVSIEPSTMMLVKMRPLPPCAWTIRGNFVYCRRYPNCAKGDDCTYAHSIVEQHTWNFIKTLYKEKQLIDMIFEARLIPQSPTNVCVKCFHEAQVNDNTRWLPWLECAQPNDHAKYDRITVVVNDDHKLVQVAEIPSCLLRCPPSQLSLCRKITQPKGCSGACNSAHSYEELQYWKWSIVHNSIRQGKVPRFETLCNIYSYTPDEMSLNVVGLQRKLSPRNYISKFHKLVYLDELAHCRKMATL